MTVLVASLLVLSAGGALFAVVFTRRAVSGSPPADAVDRTSGLVRVRAEVHTGSEQCLLALVHELDLPRRPEGLPYGRLYFETSTRGGAGITVRTLSMIDRGLVAPITATRRPGHTEVVYSIARLPRDDAVRGAVLDFEMQFIAALRRVDPTSSVRLVGTALRDLDALQRAQFTAEEHADRA